MIIFTTLIAAAGAAGLVDDPILGNEVTYLDNDWMAQGGEYNIEAKVPGDLLTDLQTAGLIPDPLYELNFKNGSIWSNITWVYTTYFHTSCELVEAIRNKSTEVLLVFDGIKMGASIELNGNIIGTAVDQFVRYSFKLSDYVDGLVCCGTGNELRVHFDPNILVDGRFMACSGGWDWAPYTPTYTPSNPVPAHTFSKGIWKSVYLVQTSSAFMTYIVPHVFYKGDFPTSALQPGKHAPFEVVTRVHFASSQPVAGTLTVSGSWGQSVSSAVSLSGDKAISITLPAAAESIELWWPTGMGKQRLYDVNVQFRPDDKSLAILTGSRRIGFRYFALVTGNDTDASWVAKNKDAEGTVDQHMLWRVNGAPIYARGANMIPMEELEGRMREDAHRIIVQSAVDGKMNTLRVWGGGIFLPNVFYDTCDELGVLVFHDMQYAQEGHNPRVSAVQEQEFRHQVRRLSHHPSIVIWDGCNECQVVVGTPTEIYSKFVLTVVVEEDKSRVVWPSSPAIGWAAGVNRLSSIPTGKPLVPQAFKIDGRDTRRFEAHGPYQHGTGFPAVNGDKNLLLFDSMIPFRFLINPTGLTLNSEFSSEFGASVFSSFESMSPTLDPKHWGIHAGMPGDDCSGGFSKNCTGVNPMSDRNYPCDNFIVVYFGQDNFDATGEKVFKKHLWQCMIGQALLVKHRIEAQRSTNCFGTLIWQLGEIWPTGGWGSIEYGTPVPGQVLGGRWKPLHYWLRAASFSDVFVTCGFGGQCVIKNDVPLPFKGRVVINEITLATGQVRPLFAQDLLMAPGPGISSWFKLTTVPDGKTSVLSGVITNEKGDVICDNAILFDVPKNMKLPKANLKVAAAEKANPDGTVDITVTSDSVAVFVTLTTLAHGRFSDNAFIFTPKSRVVKFIPFGPLDLGVLRSSLRVEDVSLYQA